MTTVLSRLTHCWGQLDSKELLNFLHLEGSSRFSSKHFQYSSRAPQQTCLSFIEGAAMPVIKLLTKRTFAINRALESESFKSPFQRFFFKVRFRIFNYVNRNKSTTTTKKTQNKTFAANILHHMNKTRKASVRMKALLLAGLSLGGSSFESLFPYQ